VCFRKNFFSRFFPPIFWSRYSCVYKKRVFALFPDDFFNRFLLAIYVCFRKKKFWLFFPPFFVTIFICYKKTCFRTFLRLFFSNIFGIPYSCVFGKIFSRVFFPRFFGHDIRVLIKKRISHFFQTIFSHRFLVAIFVFLE